MSGTHAVTPQTLLSRTLTLCSRVHHLEAQVGNIQQSLNDIVRLLTSGDAAASLGSVARLTSTREDSQRHGDSARLIGKRERVSPSDPDSWQGGHSRSPMSDSAAEVERDHHFSGAGHRSSAVQGGNEGFEISHSPSRRTSNDSEDVLALKEISNPLGVMSDMADLVEAEDQLGGVRATGAMASDGDPRSLDDASNGPPTKRARLRGGSHVPIPSTIHGLTQSAPGGGTGRSSARANGSARGQDPVTAGLISEEEGRELMKMYARCQRRPISDLVTDVTQILLRIRRLRQLF